jgi:hypothetical protein
MAISLIEFVLEFYPVQAQGVQEAFHDIHAHEYCESGVGQLEKSYTNESCFHNQRLFRFQLLLNQLLEKHFG